MTKYPFAALLVAGLSVALLKAQAPAGLEFEVASLRPHPVARGVIMHVWLPTFQCPPKGDCIQGNRFHEQAVGLAELIVDAYKVKKFQIAGLPPWGDSGTDVFDLEAKLPGETPPTVGQVRLMLQAFLADRFQLRIHHETRTLSVYALVPAKKGVKLVPANGPCRLVPGYDGQPPKTRPETAEPPLEWAFYAQSVSIFAHHQPIIDETGLDGSGRYCTADGVDPTRALAFDIGGSPSLAVFDAVEDAWGMKLESKKAPVDVIVIDKVEKPSEN
jgi:uncharacterized protein (TIGR03435 family)